METNGKISVIKKPEKDTVSAEMLQLHVPDKGIETVIISDGEISDFSLKLCEKRYTMGISNFKAGTL